jgi:hypothetical protein
VKGEQFNGFFANRLAPVVGSFGGDGIGGIVGCSNGK